MIPDVSRLPAAERRLNTVVTDCAVGQLAFQIHYWGAVPRHYSNPVHRHSFYEVCYVLDGEGEYQDADEVYPISAGTLFLSRSGIWHQIRSSGGMALLYAAYEIGKAHSDSAAAARYDRCMRHAERVVIADAHEHPSGLYWRALIEQAAKMEGHAPEVRLTAGLLLLSFLQVFTGENATDPGTEEQQQPLTSSKWVYQAKQFIRDNLSKPLRLEQVAGYFNLSERHLSRMFQLYSDQSFSEYLKSERIRCAERLLKTTNLTIKEIAEQAGFASVHYFTRVFSAARGCPPGAFRESAFGRDMN